MTLNGSASRSLQKELVETVEIFDNGGKHLYRVHYKKDYGYKVQRRVKPTSDEINRSFWIRSVEVEVYIQLEQFDQSYYARPIKWLSSLTEVVHLITTDKDD